MKAVLDTNVWVSGFLNPDGIPGQILDAVRDRRVSVVSSPRLWSELQRTLSYRRVRTPLEQDGLWDDVLSFLVAQPDVIFVHEVEPTSSWVPNDRDDDWVIQCALTANAEYIISGDRHLLSLGEVGPVRILSPADFVAEVLDQE
jgi:putative PIN family toxin of toxin-antitoxin system